MGVDIRRQPCSHPLSAAAALRGGRPEGRGQGWDEFLNPSLGQQRATKRPRVTLRVKLSNPAQGFRPIRRPHSLPAPEGLRARTDVEGGCLRNVAPLPRNCGVCGAARHQGRVYCQSAERVWGTPERRLPKPRNVAPAERGRSPPRRGGPDPHLSGWPSSGPSSRIAAPRPGPRPSAPGTPSGNRTQTRQASRLRCRVDKGTRGGVYRTSDKTNTQQESFKLRMCADVQAAGNRLGSSRRLGEASLFAGGSSFVSSALTFPLLILSRK